MPAPASRLAPIFRSKTQLAILTALYVRGGTFTITELSNLTDISMPLVSREVTRLEQTDLALVERRGQLRLVTANERHPSAVPLRQLLDQTAGALHHLKAQLLEPRWSAITKAVVFGSWARRFHGEPGAAPNDLDVILVAEEPISMADVTVFQRELSARVALPVDAFVVSAAEWRSPTPDTATWEIQKQPLVEVEPTIVERAEAG